MGLILNVDMVKEVLHSDNGSPMDILSSMMKTEALKKKKYIDVDLGELGVDETDRQWMKDIGFELQSLCWSKYRIRWEKE